MNRRAFTLVELLVVVAIIVALLAILLPSLNRAVAAAQSAVCTSNQKQLGVAFLSYAADHRAQLFPVTHTGDSYWFHRLSPQLGIPGYVDDPLAYRDGAMEVMHCPSSEKVEPTVGAVAGHAFRDWSFENGAGSYGMNLWLTPGGLFYGDAQVGPTADFFTSFFDVTRSSSTPLFSDAMWVGGWPSENDIAAPSLLAGDWAHFFGRHMGRFTIDRHGMAVNAVMHDGSAIRVPLEGLWSLTWHRNWSGGVAPDLTP